MIQQFTSELKRLVGEIGKYRYLLAVSGGADSSVLAHLFHSAGLNFAVAHCNFHLRGEDSNRDMRAVQSLAQSLNVPFFLKEFDTPTLQKNSGRSVEMMARELRYDWFEEIGRDYDFIVTAHHANDAAETMLLNLCRGTGLKGVASIPEKNGKIIRPLLSFSASEIRTFAQKQNISYVFDYTNDDETIKRNRIRKSVIPILEELNPNLICTLSHNRKIFQKQLLFYQNCLENIKKEAISKKDDFYVINTAFLAENPHKDVILYEILNDFGFNASVVEDLIDIGQSGKQFFSEQYALLVDRDSYIIKPLVKGENESHILENEEDLKRFFQVEKHTLPDSLTFPKNNNVLFLPAEKLTFPLTLRHWREGDFFHPLGAKGKQKVSDFFTDHKIDIYTKQKIWFLCNEKDIVWIVGYRSNELYKIDIHNTKLYYTITYDGFFK